MTPFGISRTANTVLSRLSRIAGLNQRGVWSRPGRHHIEVHGVARADGDRLARQVETDLGQLPGVAWARINAPSGRVVVAVRDPEPPLPDLIAVIAAAEESCGPAPDGVKPPPHPPEEGPRTRRAMVALAADALGLGLAATAKILPIPSVPREVAGLIKAVDLHPKLHALADRRAHGDHRAKSSLLLAEAMALALTGGWTGLVLDGAQRFLQWGEARAQLAAWERIEPQLAGTPERAAALPRPDERPRPKPDGPIERYVTQSLAGGAIVGALALPLAGYRRAAGLALASLPRAAAAGREGFATRLGRLLAHRGVITMDRRVLRELERLDTLVLDAAVLNSSRGTLTDLWPMPDADVEEVALRAFDLFNPDAPTALTNSDGWQLGPFNELGLPARTGSEQADRIASADGTVLGLVTDGTLAAVLTVAPEPAPGVDALARAARRAGLRLVVAGPDESRYGFADALMPGGGELAGSVRRLQADGATVAVVSADRRALGAADCGLGLWDPDQPAPWGAHLLTGTDLALPALVVEAAGVARTVARQSIALAGAGSVLSGLVAFNSVRSRLLDQTAVAFNAAAGLALADGVWHAHQVPGPSTSLSGSAPPWHLMPAQTVLAQLGTDLTGLADEEVNRRRRSTTSAQDGGISLGRAFVEELSNPLTPVLAAGAGLSAAVGSAVDASLVGGVVGLSALLGAGQRIRTERSLATLLSRSAVTARVRRGDAEQVVTAAELVPGDIITVEPGDAIPADCRLIEQVGLETDESSLTGESLPVAKTTGAVVAASVADRRSMLYEGTTVAAGRGLAVVVATGADTEVGRGMALADGTPPNSGVEARLTSLTKKIIPLAAGSAVSVAAAGLLRGVPLAESAATAANLAVASVPEGLPFLASAAQLAAARRLAEHGALVRNPRTIEALGRVDVLCFDKTGTLTEGRLRLAGVGDGRHYAPADHLDRLLRPVLTAALRATPAAEAPEQLTQQTDRAVLAGARTVKVGTGSHLHQWHPVAALPFEPSRGYYVALGKFREAFLFSVKGAPEAILPRCTRHRTADGEQPLDTAGRTALHELMGRYAGAGQRVLAVAERQLPTGAAAEADIEANIEANVEELTFLGFITLADQVRESAAPAVRRIRAAGVHTIMITGDHPATAEAIASIISTDDTAQRVVTATQLEALDDDALAELLARTDVVARCTPAHKVRLIQAMQKCGRTVAMTGDGANDAPAIRLADVGIALGQRGTPAARAAADLVVTDDRLETIIATLIEGRAMWSSVRHALSILVGGNLGEIAFSVLTAAATGRSALNGRQLLLVNLLTDLVPAMAIAVRAPRPDAADDLLSEGPDSSLGETLNREIGLRAAATAFGATSGWTLARLTGRRRRAGTVALAALVGTQLGQTLVDGRASRSVLLSTAASLAALATVIQTPGVSQFFGCTPLGPIGWSIAAGSAIGATASNTALGRLTARWPDAAEPDAAEPDAAEPDAAEPA